MDKSLIIRELRGMKITNVETQNKIINEAMNIISSRF